MMSCAHYECILRSYVLYSVWTPRAATLLPMPTPRETMQSVFLEVYGLKFVELKWLRSEVLQTTSEVLGSKSVFRSGYGLKFVELLLAGDGCLKHRSSSFSSWLHLN